MIIMLKRNKLEPLYFGRTHCQQHWRLNQNNVFSYKAIGGIALTVIMPIIFIWVACSVVIFRVIWQHLFWLGNFILENTHDKEPYCYGLFKDIHNLNVQSQCSTMLSKTRLYYVCTEASRNSVRSKLAGSGLWCSGCCMFYIYIYI